MHVLVRWRIIVKCDSSVPIGWLRLGGAVVGLLRFLLWALTTYNLQLTTKQPHREQRITRAKKILAIYKSSPTDKAMSGQQALLSLFAAMADTYKYKML